MRTLVVIPTYNEIDNIDPLVESIHQLVPDVDILFVDDNSPDGTAQKIQDLQRQKPFIHLLFREKKEGLGRAYIAGFQWALERNYDWIVEMDADFSHRPEDLRNILSLREKLPVDFIVGSRWVDQGGTINWNLLRKVISLGGSLYSRWVLGFPLRDWTGGFNFWSQKVLKELPLQDILSNGYSFQIELKYRALKKGFQVLESPILFAERRSGKSKMSFRILWEALFKVWKIREIK